MTPDDIVVVGYDPSWPEQFAALSNALREALNDLARAVEHVGSTSVPGLAAKPILDIDIVIASRTDLPKVIERLEVLGYYHQGDLGVPGREAFGRTAADVPRTGTSTRRPEHHLYVCTEDSSELKRHLDFRDFLRAHPLEASRYAQLKRELAAACGNDREAYGRGKTDFVEQALARKC